MLYFDMLRGRGAPYRTSSFKAVDLWPLTFSLCSCKEPPFPFSGGGRIAFPQNPTARHFYKVHSPDALIYKIIIHPRILLTDAGKSSKIIGSKTAFSPENGKAGYSLELSMCCLPYERKRITGAGRPIYFCILEVQLGFFYPCFVFLSAFLPFCAAFCHFLREWELPCIHHHCFSHRLRLAA